MCVYHVCLRVVLGSHRTLTVTDMLTFPEPYTTLTHRGTARDESRHFPISPDTHSSPRASAAAMRVIITVSDWPRLTELITSSQQSF